MNKTPVRSLLLRTGIVVVVVTLLHLALLVWMAESRTASTLLAAGQHTSLVSLALAASFVAVRFVAIVVLPGWVIYRLVRICLV